MEKLTAQIAALHLGQKCLLKKVFRVGSIDAIELAHVRVRFDEGTPVTAYYSIEYVRPILRPLSSLTESEARELYEIKFGFEYDGENCTEEYWGDFDSGLDTMLSYSVGNPKIWLKLLSWGFDLFGLIESGLAIDATKIETETTV